MAREGELLNELWLRRAWARPALQYAVTARTRPVPAYVPAAHGTWWQQPYTPNGHAHGGPQAPVWNPYLG